MPSPALIATQLTDHATRTHMLFVGGVDTLNGSVIRTPVDSIKLVENGPGAASTLDFEVWDSTSAMTIGEGTEVQFWDITNNVCLFRGEIDGWSSSPMAAGGRVLSIGCIGVEAWLDWVYVPAGTLFSGQYSLPNISGILTKQYAPMLKAPHQQPGMSSAPYSQAGSFDYPLGSFVRSSEPSNAIIFTDWTTPGGTLRDTLNSLVKGVAWFDVTAAVFTPVFGVKALYTVDFYMGLRAWEDDILLQPDDYTTLTVTNTVAGSRAATRLDYNVEIGDIEHEVYVAGGNAAGSGLFGDGSGIRGKQGLITDSTITTADNAANQARNYLAAQAASVRGTLSIRNFTAPTTVHAGSLLSLTDAPSGATGTYRIYSIAKTFESTGKQNWEVAFGGLPRSTVRFTRRLTRAFIS